MSFRRSRFRRRMGPKWGYAKSGLMTVVDGQLTDSTVATWLLPPGRAQYLMETRNRDSLQFAGCHLWLDFHWIAPSGGGGGFRGIPDTTFYVMKDTTSGGLADVPLHNDEDPWAEPNYPSNITNWNESTLDDGTEPFLWTHWIKGMSPPNAFVGTYDYNSGTNAASNQGDRIGSSGTEGQNEYLCRTFSTRMEWQPDVVIRTKRRLVKNEGIAITMKVRGDTGCTASLSWHVRCLTK